MRKLQRLGLVMGMWLFLSAGARADTFTWNGTVGLPEQWSSTSNWTPVGLPDYPDTVEFDSPVALLHDIIMPTYTEIGDVELRNGLYQFRRVSGGGTPWLLQFEGSINPTNNWVWLNPDDGGDSELRVRDGRINSQRVIMLGSSPNNASAVLDVENSVIFANTGISIGGGTNSTALITLTNSELDTSFGSEIFDGGTVEVLANSSATFSTLDLRGDLLIGGGGFVNAALIEISDSGLAVVSKNGTLSPNELRVLPGGELLVEGDDGQTATVDANTLHSLSTGGTVTIGNLGRAITGRLIGAGINLQAGGFLQVPAEFFEVAPANFNWTGGELEFLGDFHVDSTGADNPFGPSMTVSAGRTLDVGPTDGALHVGTTTQGALTIAGGTVTSDTAIIGGSIAATGPATVNVSGATGRWNVEGNLRAGGFGTAAAAISVSGGADVVVVDAHIGTLGKIANVTIDGVGSSLVSSDSVFLGGDATTAGGQGTLALTNSGIIGVGNSSNDQLKVWDGYTVTMNQAAINTRNLVVRGTIAPAPGTLISGSITAVNSVVIDGGSVTLTTFGPASLVASSNVDILAGGSLSGYIQGNSGTEVLVTGAGSSWTTPNVVANVLGTTVSGVGRIGQLTVGPGGTVNFGAGVSYEAGATDGFVLFDGTLNAPTFNGGTVGITGRGTVNAAYTGSGTIQATGTLTIGNATSASGFATTGSIIVGANTVTLNDLDAAQLGTATIIGFSGAPGTLIAANGLAVGSGETVFGFGTINTPNNAAKRLTNDGSIIGTGTAQRVMLTGDVAGIGSFSNVEFTGTLSPGNPTLGLATGAMSGSNYKFTQTSNLVMDIQGANPGFGYDLLFTTGEFIADGTLTLNLLNGYSPTLGQSFNMLDFTTLTGTFDTLDLPLLELGLTWNTSQLYTTGILSVAAGFLEADFEEDGDVDGDDLVRWQGSIGVLTGGADHGDGDADADGDVDGRDFMIWQRQYTGKLFLTAESTAVPEPGSLVLLSLFVVVWNWCGRRR
jgi:hypothetical protein